MAGQEASASTGVIDASAPSLSYVRSVGDDVVFSTLELGSGHRDGNLFRIVRGELQIGDL